MMLNKQTLSKTVTIVNQRGLHARAAAKFAKLANSFDTEISVRHKNNTASGKDILDLLTLAASKGCDIDIIVSYSADQKKALHLLSTLVENGFEED